MASEKKKLGRPRDEGARKRVLDTVRQMLRSGSLCGLSMEGIAREAGTGKVTVYRWWPNTAAIALEVLLEDAGEACPVPDTGDLAADLRTFLRGTFAAVESGSTGTLLRCLMVEAQRNPDFREQFRERFIRSRQEALAGLLRRHKASSKERAVLIDMLFGAMWYRLLIGHGALDRAFADQLLHLAMRLLQNEDAPTVGLRGP
jgi:AcrR family transcriptional regulator